MIANRTPWGRSTFPHTFAFRYGLAILTGALALALALRLPITTETPLLLFIVGVVITALYGGLGPALLNIGLAAWAISFFFVTPYQQLTFWKVMSVEDTILLSIFLMVALVIGCLVAGSRRAREISRIGEEWYRSLAATASDGIITVNDQETILFVNAAAERIFGFSEEQLLGRKLSVLFPQDLYRWPMSQQRRCPDTRKRQTHYLMEGRAQGGAPIALQVSFSAFSLSGKSVYTAILRESGAFEADDRAGESNSRSFARLLMKPVEPSAQSIVAPCAEGGSLFVASETVLQSESLLHSNGRTGTTG